MYKSKICSEVFPTSHTQRLKFSVCPKIKKLTLNRLILRNKTILTFVNGPMVDKIVKAFFIAP